MRRATILPLGVVLALVSAVALLCTAQALSTPTLAVDAPTSAAAETAVRRFYAAVNQAIRTGDTEPLRAAVAPDLVVHGGTADVAPGLAGFERWLLALHDLQPELELSIEDFVADGDRVIARPVARRPSSGSFLGIPLRVESPVWGAFDVLRLVDGRVAELWSTGNGLALLEPLVRIAFDPPAASEVAVGLSRLTVAPGASATASDQSLPQVLVVETGTLEVCQGCAEPALSDAPAGAGRRAATGASGEAITLRPGDGVTIPAQTRFVLRNGGTRHAVVLHAGFPLADAAIGRSTGVHVQRLTGRLGLDVPDGSAIVAIGRATLAPGGALTLDGAAGSVLLAVESGPLSLAVESGTAEIGRRDGQQPIDAPGLRQPQTRMLPGQRQSVTSDLGAVLRARDGALIPSGARSTLRNAGEEPVVVVVLTILADDRDRS